MLDILKPHKPDILEFGRGILEEESVKGLNISVFEVDKETESVKLVLNGEDIDFEGVREKIESLAGVVHSIDKAILGKEEVIKEPE